MYATIIDMNGIKIYSSFFSDREKAIEYAKSMSGIIAVEIAHSNQTPIWTRKNKETLK
jgi:hypothetical protein|tara:strand:+ start:41 stop:214 length:174 start_codon:yes stop_codon:yes gene_type:complete